MGTFALNAGIAGAKEVTGLDISEFAVKQATENARRNNLSDTVKFRCANVLDELPHLAADGEKYDVVILDPPAFTKSREATKNAIKGYREINMKGLRLVKDGGYLATCSVRTLGHRSFSQGQSRRLQRLSTRDFVRLNSAHRDQIIRYCGRIRLMCRRVIILSFSFFRLWRKDNPKNAYFIGITEHFSEYEIKDCHTF